MHAGTWRARARDIRVGWLVPASNLRMFPSGGSDFITNPLAGHCNGGSNQGVYQAGLAVFINDPGFASHSQRLPREPKVLQHGRPYR